MRITIPFKTPSVNHLYFHWNNRTILTKEARQLKQKIKELLANTSCDCYNSKLSVTTTIYEQWYNKDGSVKKKDIANREKFLIDAIFEALELEDKFIFKNTLIKENSFTEFAEVLIEPIQ